MNIEKYALEENVDVAQQGGGVAGVARKALEQKTGRPIITSQNAQNFRQSVLDIVEVSITSLNTLEG